MVTLPVHQRTEAFVGGDQTFGLYLCQLVENTVQTIKQTQFVLQKTRPSFQAEVAGCPGLAQELTRLLVIELFGGIGGALPPPEKHFLGDDPGVRWSPAE